MKKNKDCNKKHESTIGKIIYGFLLFMPLLAIGITCSYAIFNKNAYQSYSDEYVASTQIVNDTTMIQENENYSFNIKTFQNNTPYYTTIGKFKYNSISINWNDILPLTRQLTPQEQDLVNGFVFYLDNTSLKLRLKLFNNETQIYEYFASTEENQFRNTEQSIYFNFNSFGTWNIGSYQTNYTSQALSIIMYKTFKLDEVFYYSIDKVEESNIFNWAKNSLIYTGLQNTCEQLSITNTFIPMLLAYWLIISVLYFLYDIILIILNIFHRKIHELQESI